MNRMMNKLKLQPVAVLAAAAALVMAASCSNGEYDYTGSGTIEATEVKVSAETQGAAMNVRFDEGGRVHANDTLVAVDIEQLTIQKKAAEASLEELDWNSRAISREIEAARESISQAKARRENARRTTERITNLVGRGAATQDKLDKAETELEVAEAAVRAAENKLAALQAKRNAIEPNRKKIEANIELLEYQIAKGNILAPADGIILEKLIEQGELVLPGAPVATIADLSKVWLMVYVGERDLGKIKLGSAADVHVDSHPDETFDGTVTWISPRAEFTPKNVQTRESRVDLVYAVKVSIPNDDGIFKIGMPADADIEGVGGGESKESGERTSWR